MPNRQRDLDPTDPRDRFTARLRELRVQAMANARTQQELDALEVQGLTRATGLSRATVHGAFAAAACGGFASERTLLRILMEFRRHVEIDPMDWLDRRRRGCEAARPDVAPHPQPAGAVGPEAARPDARDVRREPIRPAAHDHLGDSAQANGELGSFLRRLRLKKGKPSFEEMARAGTVSPTTLATAARGTQRLRWETVTAFVTALEADQDEVAEAFRLWLEAEEATSPSPTPSLSVDAGRSERPPFPA
jgi:transcriptional regulator with XRE-family HTH domain